jgi:hypothetical protein
MGYHYASQKSLSGFIAPRPALFLWCRFQVAFSSDKIHSLVMDLLVHNIAFREYMITDCTRTGTHQINQNNVPENKVFTHP